MVRQAAAAVVAGVAAGEPSECCRKQARVLTGGSVHSKFLEDVYVARNRRIAG